MRLLGTVIALVGTLGTAMGFLGANAILAVLGVVVFLVGYGVLTLGKRTQPQMNLDAESRALFRPVWIARQEIAHIVERAGDSAHVKVIGKEVLAEADQVLFGAARLAKARASLRRIVKERTRAEFAARDARQRATIAKTDTERDEYIRTAELIESQVHQFEKGRIALQKTDSQLAAAVTELNELRVMLAASLVGAAADDVAGEEVSEVVTRLKSLRQSLVEAEEMVEGRA